MTFVRKALVALMVCFVICSVSAARVLAVGPAPEPTFGTPGATATLGKPLVFTSPITGADGSTVEVLIRLAGKETAVVVAAQPGTEAGAWQATAEVDVPSSIECSCLAKGNSAPNSHIEYQFRVRTPAGVSYLGPSAQAVVEDTRFTWQQLDDKQVRVHWYDGDQAFASTAAAVANGAIDKASQLLGVTLPAPVDLFIYSTQQALLDAVSPNRENIAGEAHSTIATMFVWIAPNDPFSDSKVTVAHELTHLVFNEATHNSFHSPPRWLNEGIAVYLSEGYSSRWTGTISAAARKDDIIPLQGLAGFFPSPPDQFELAYGESVSAVDFFIRTYTDQRLWDLVRSYSQGLSDDDAFHNATGSDVAAFNAAWTQSLGASVREPVGPQPAPPGPIPPGWTVGGAAGATALLGFSGAFVFFLKRGRRRVSRDEPLAGDTVESDHAP